uniref:COMM domain-containing protein n=1 Tax=Nelumbo nucifera TaxID=4432 RepID=A0A822ZA94_NELNU|nr:TPA_asm: hypothetical protein HUJ06_001434 [Nelumbo nucifera]
MEDTLFLQLHKLSAAASEETLAHVFESLWKSRKTGLKPLEKSYIQSLLNLPSAEELDPVLACLRSLIRKCLHENFIGNDILKLFPHDLPLELQSILLLLLQKYQDQWKEETSRDQGILPRLKSMTWTMENRKSKPADRVAVISLKLQDYAKSPLGETEVKFQLTKDTLEAMLRSMAYISEQLSNIAGPSSGPLQKKMRQ